MIDFSLKGKSAIVTGASGNLGPIWVEALEDLGCTVYKFDLPKYDITDRLHIRNFFNELPGFPDILINNAGKDNPPNGKIGFWHSEYGIIHVNLVGAMHMCRAFIFKESDAPINKTIINISSIYGMVAANQENYPDDFEKPVAYNVSKAGLIQLTRSIAAQYGSYGIRCNALTLGPYDNGKHDPGFKERFLKSVPMGRMSSKQDMKQALWGILMGTYQNGANVVHDGGYLCC